MTRFARAKGSKASNEKLPEQASSWSEMKQELLHKNKELAEKKEREAALKQRQENYRSFLQEQEEQADKKMAWADFPELQENNGRNSINANDKKRKFGVAVEEGNQLSNKKYKLDDLGTFPNESDSDEDSDGQFSALKSKIDEVLAKQNGNSIDSDDEAPPEEASIKQKPEEIVVKKVKKPKQKLKIVIDKEGKAKEIENAKVKKELEKDSEKELSNLDKKKIQKRHERQSKQNEKKLLKRMEQKKMKKAKKQNNEEVEENVQVSQTSMKEDNNMENGVKEEDANNVNQKDPAMEKKLARRQKQKEKRRLKRLQARQASQGLSDCTPQDKNQDSKKKEILNKTKKVKNLEDLTEEELKKIQKKKEKLAKQKEKRKKFKENALLAATADNSVMENGDTLSGNSKIQKTKIKSNATNKSKNFHDQDGKQELNGKQLFQNDKHGEQNNYSEKKPFQNNVKNQNMKKAKLRDNKVHPSRKQKPEKMIINGKTIEVDYVDGFPVKKEDADRLKKLRKEMISKGLPRSEINVALKLERRRAEKAFAREKKNVCFNCRKSGHNLSECPELDKDQVAQSSGTGICFKCGSTEHTHFECKVVRGMDYKFANCFICKEQGHIAKQCPDNQRGLYPKGGACKVCGDVTHLKKDCPKYQAQQVQLQNSLSIGTLDSSNPDDLGGKGTNFSSAPVRRLNKIVKF